MSNQIQIFRNFQSYDSFFKKLLTQQSMIEQGGRIIWIGPDKELAKVLKTRFSKKTKSTDINLKKQLVLPAFIECHTHAMFAGSRADEFELRNQGVSYLEIAARGGGILSTMKKTRLSSKAQLQTVTQKFINEFQRQGVATVEIKTGYALDLKNEVKMLEAMKALSKKNSVMIIPTYLGPHALPPEFKNHKDYLDYILESVLPVLKKRGLTKRADIFIEQKFFSAQDGEAYLLKAKDLGFDLTIHANQLSQSGGAELAQKIGAKSADHVIELSDQAIKGFGRSATIPVLLPAADLYMKCPYPKARKLIDAGAEVALATDFNPGSCPTQDLMLVGLLARLEMKMTLPEVFRAYTLNASRALGLEHEQGQLLDGQKAQFIVTESALTDFFYSAGKVPTHQLYLNGKKMNKTLNTGI